MAVSALDNPLSVDIIEEAALQTPMVATHPKDTQGARQPTGNTEVNSSLSFFNQFVQDANHRSTSCQSVLLGELLNHKDDSLYFLKDKTPISDIISPLLKMLSMIVDDSINLHQDLDPDYLPHPSIIHSSGVGCWGGQITDP